MDKDIGNPSAVEKVAALAKDAAGFTLRDVTLVGLGDGLPPTIPVGFDHRSQGVGVVKDMRELAEKWRLFPQRRRGTAQVLTLQSFIDLTNRHKTAHSVIFASSNWPNPSMTAVIDYHEKDNGKPDFGEHRVVYSFPVTDEFKAWTNQDTVGMDQTEFAGFIEERVAELAQATSDEEREFTSLFQTKMATPADMLTLSRGLEINVAGKVKQNVRLSSGEGEIVFTEEHTDGKGNRITVPGLFMVSVPAFIDGEPVRLPARLRYRVGGGAVTWFFQLYRWKEIVRERVVGDLELAQIETDLPAFEGSPEQSR